MTEFVVFALYICFGVTTLIVAPILMIPGLSPKRKLLICGFTFFVLIPLALTLYAYLGAPKMAISS